MFIVFVLYIAFHLLAQLLAQRVMIPQFGYGLLIVIVLFILHVALVYDSTDHADHVPEERSAA